MYFYGIIEYYLIIESLNLSFHRFIKINMFCISFYYLLTISLKIV